MLRLEARPKNIEGEGEIAIRELVRNSLRMRPDRIIVGEVRGAEALDMLQAMNTGHDGSLSTVHANSPRDALARIETMVLMAGFDLPVRAIRQQVASALDLIVHLERLEDGSRRVTSITEVQRMESDVITLQELFEFQVERGHAPTGWSSAALAADRPAADVPDQVREARHRAADQASSVRAACPSPRKGCGREAAAPAEPLLALCAVVAHGRSSFGGQPPPVAWRKPRARQFPDRVFVLTLPSRRPLDGVTAPCARERPSGAQA